MSAKVLVVGKGLLAEFVCAELSVEYHVIHQTNFKKEDSKTANLALVLDDAWDPANHRKTEEVLQSTGIPWLRGFVFFGEGVIGPMVRPGKPGCSKCSDLRRIIAGPDRIEMWEMQKNLEKHGKWIKHDAWASRSGLIHMAYIIATESFRVLQGRGSHLEERLFIINLKNMKSTLHSFLPDPLCSVCGQSIDEMSTDSQISLQSSPKINVDSYRSHSLNDLKEVLVKDYLDNRTGMINGKNMDLLSPFADISVNLPLFKEDVGTGGRSHFYTKSELTAILEGLERYCGLAPRSNHGVIHDSFNRISDQALNPFKVGLHEKEQYKRPNFPFHPFDPDRAMNWVWGYSFLQERPILVPQWLPYYNSGSEDGFVYETSNGCALGGSLEEAIFYGILEIVERDSFLMTWYAKLPVPRIDLSSESDLELHLMVQRLREVTGFDLHVFNTTMENGIPSVWVVAKKRDQKGVNFICAAGTHLDPIQAVKSAIHELVGTMQMLHKQFDAKRWKVEQMFYDPFLVQEMQDHSMLYNLPKAQERLQFLLNSNRPVKTFDESYSWKERHADLTDDLKDIIQVFRRLNLDVIVVNQTRPEISRNGLHCVKVLIPGMLPMTFGHQFTRLAGMDRVLKVPMKLGYVKQPLTAEQLNPHPHPFP
ncbi:TOMM precursor leader peptide-binding protein [Oceanobacillus salinisoli]|uniref:TOMM precursor leader peptide-binding protein n=1 Tax=Oceanobacillus salinisoli TaxID=2678611 RepID=UPI0012E2547B|nr:TOMM precursor leader peptide-binding protein [Oceanobacillus salinisoli]